MPEDSASSGLSATARMAFPMRARCRNTATAIRSTAESAMIVKSRGVTANGPKVHSACSA